MIARESLLPPVGHSKRNRSVYLHTAVTHDGAIGAIDGHWMNWVHNGLYCGN